MQDLRLIKIHIITEYQGVTESLYLILSNKITVALVLFLEWLNKNG